MDQHAPYNYFLNVTPSDTVDLERMTDAIYVGVTGDIAVVGQNGVPVTFKAVPVGQRLDVQARRVNAAGTTATNLVALFYL
ncbi:MAG TPA: hypothetical protein VN903_09750 [Polyangia bacterium]|nr:hypothetical protein [Polyangia bacterium]